RWKSAQVLPCVPYRLRITLCASENKYREDLMHRALFLGSLALAFVAGATALRLSPQAQAANELTPMVIHVPDLAGDKLGIASGTGLRSKAFVVQDGMTLA